MAKDSKKTKRKIIEGLGRLLAREGFEKIGINAVAREAKVDKVLIYRYFGGMPQLLKAYAEEGDFGPDWEGQTGYGQDELAGLGLKQATTAILSGHLAQLRKNPLTQEIMRWELMTRNELTDELARAREKMTARVMETLGRSPDQPGMPEMLAAGAILHAGITYLVLRSATADVYMGVDLTTEAGWERIDKAVKTLVESFFDKMESSDMDKEED